MYIMTITLHNETRSYYFIYTANQTASLQYIFIDSSIAGEGISNSK